MDSRINNGMCRCCASEGTFKDLASTYHWMGEEEIYAEMLKECFDIHLNSSDDGEEGGICEVCITQLRNASNFKKQVLHTEKQFKKRLHDKLFKNSIVKVEVPGPDEDALESDNDNNVSEDFSGTEFEVPIKEEEIEEPKPKKRAAKATSSRAKKAKIEHGETSTKRYGSEAAFIEAIEPNVSSVLLHLLKSGNPTKANNEWAVTINTKNKRRTKDKQLMFDPEIHENLDDIKMTNKRNIKAKLIKDIRHVNSEPLEIHKHLHNIRLILLYSNATPIRAHTTSGFFCHLCPKSFLNPADLKQHTLENHDELQKEKFMEGYPLISYVVKLDITGLQCFICHDKIDSLQELVDHLQYEHDKEYYTDINNHILPFKFERENMYQCVLCPNTYFNFKQIHEHMSSHYNNYMCEVCSRPFVNKHTLRGHRKRHEKGEYKCSFCSKVFSTSERKMNHQRHVHLGDQKRNKCPRCPAKFVSYNKRNQHMVEVHGAKQAIFKCLACDKTFTEKDRLTWHTRRDHLLERTHECNECDGKFFTEKDLKRHMIKHTGEKKFQCSHCMKEFGRRSTLREHLRIHYDDRRFTCEKCGQAFVQKCSWRSHLKTKHGVIT